VKRPNSGFDRWTAIALGLNISPGAHDLGDYLVRHVFSGVAGVAVTIALLLVAGCDTTDDDYSSTGDSSGSYDSSYDTASVGPDSSTYEPSYSSDSSSSSSYSNSTYDPPPTYQNDYSSSNDFQSLQNDLTEADNYHYNNDD